MSTLDAIVAGKSTEIPLDPPRTLGGTLKYVGPGAVLAALAIGGGELVLNPRAGAMYGFGLAWLVVVGLFCKYWVTQEIGRYATVTGEDIFDAWSRLGKYYPIVFDGLAMIARGVSIAGNGLTLGTILFWAFPGWLTHVQWAMLMSIVSAGILYLGLYRAMEKVSLVLIGLTVVTVVTCAIAVLTGRGFSELITGILSIGHIPENSWKEALPLLGWSGEGALGTALYAAWIKEKGYGVRAGHRQELSAIEIDRAKGWLKVMRTDAGISFGLQVLACLAFMTAGAVLLQPLGLVPQGNEIAKEQARLFTEVLGPWAQSLYMLGAAGAMFTTLLVAIDCEARVSQDFLQRTGLVKIGKTNLYRMTLIFAVILTLAFSTTSAPLPLLQFGAVFDGTVMLPIAGIMTLYANYKLLPKGVKPSGLVLGITIISLAVLSVFMVIALVIGL